MLSRLKKNQFLFEELVKRDFNKKYRGAILGIFWSVLSPLLSLFVMQIAFSRFFGASTPHYIIYLFSGNIVLSFFRESTTTGMSALSGNAAIFSKIPVSKYLFVLSKNTSAFINFIFVLIVYFLFVIGDGISVTPRFLLLLFPIVCLTVFNIGAGLILSALYMFFRDVEYFYHVFLMLLTYLSAIFYTLDRFSPLQQTLFLLNPIYTYISYFRIVVIQNATPDWLLHFLCAFYAALAVGVGAWIYKKYNYQFIYYV